MGTFNVLLDCVMRDGGTSFHVLLQIKLYIGYNGFECSVPGSNFIFLPLGVCIPLIYLVIPKECNICKFTYIYIFSQ